MHVFIHGRRIAWTVYIYYFRLSERPFLGLVGEADPPPVCLLPILARSASAPYSLFLQGVSQHLRCLLSLAYKPRPF